MKAIVVDLARCNGCFNCQIACKDEHCGNDWSPIAKPEPETGSFWCRVDQRERGKVPVVKVAYTPRFFDRDEELLAAAPECVYEREDGIVIIDPEKAVGRRDLADAYEGIYWNTEYDIPQKCTMCAHLLDGGWDAPRCVDACATDALRFGDIESFGNELEDAFQFCEGSRFYYLNMPKRWIAGSVVDREANEVLIGAGVSIFDRAGKRVAALTTDEFGDFKEERFDEEPYVVRIEADGYEPVELQADCTREDVVLGDIFMVAK